MTNSEFYHLYDAEKNCMQFFRKYYSRTIKACPSCKHKHLKWSSRNIGWRCSKCSKKISLKSISFMRDSNKSFKDWMEILHLICHCKKSDSINKILRKSRQTRYETVYHMVQKIRMEMGRVNSWFSQPNITEFAFDEMADLAFHNLPKKIRMCYKKSISRKRDKIRLVAPQFVFDAMLVLKAEKRETDYPYKKLLKTRSELRFRVLMKNMEYEEVNGRWSSIIRSNALKVLKGVYNYTYVKYLQGVLDEYSFKYNYRYSKRSKIRVLMNLIVRGRDYGKKADTQLT